MPLHDVLKQNGPRMVDYVADKEPWAQYTLEDGTVIRVRIMLSKVILQGLGADGKPVYQLGMQQVVEMEPSEGAIEAAKAIGPVKVQQ